MQEVYFWLEHGTYVLDIYYNRSFFGIVFKM